jgi:transcriptional regulator with XRE-family HTH domain
MSPRQIPKHLGEKLRAIRESKRWSLERMADAVGETSVSRRTRVFEWEQGIRQPDLSILLKYAQLVGVSTDILINDNVRLDLP